MEITKSESLARNADVSRLVDESAAVLTEAMDFTAGSATWELDADRWGRPLLRLKVEDAVGGGQGSAEFAPDELRHEEQVRDRLRSLKGGVMHVNRWRQLLSGLFDDVRRWCRNLPGPAPVITEEPVVLNEVGAGGRYEVKRLVITRGRSRIEVEPIAAWVVGAEGRVDLIGNDDSFYLLYDSEQGWYYLERYPPRRTHPLTEALFLELAAACSDG